MVGVSTLLATSFRPQTGAVQAWQELTAWVTMAVALVMLVLSIFVIQYYVRDTEQKRHLQALRPQLLAASPDQVFVHAEDGRESWRQTVRATLDGDPPETTSISDALRDLQADISRALPPLPVAIIRGVVEAGALLIVAGILLVAMVNVEGWVLPEPSGGGLRVVLSAVIAVIVLVGVGIAKVLSVVPGGEVLLGLRDAATAAVVSASLGLIVAGLSMVVAGLTEEQRTASLDEVHRNVAVARVGFVAAKALGAVVLTVLGAVLLVDGHLAAAVGTLIAAGPLGWLALVGMPTVVVWVAYIVSPASVRAIGAAMQRSANRGVVRSRLLLLGMPVLVVILTFMIVSAFAESLRVGVVMALVAGLGAQMGARVWVFVRYHAASVIDDGASVSEVPVSATVLEDADGEQIYTVSVDGYSLAHRDSQQLVEAAVDAIDWRLGGRPSDGEAPSVMDALVRASEQGPAHRPCIEHEYYERAVGEGDVDFEAVRRSVLSDIETRIEASIREAGGEIDRETMLDELRAEYPPDAIEESLEFLLIETARVAKNQEKLVLR